MTKLLFLDFDGVLHPTICPPEQFFSRLPQLSLALDGLHEQPEIIIASSWRFHHSLSALKKRFPKAISVRIVGTTGDAVVGRYARFREIEAYLMRRADATQWIALDDSAFEFPNTCFQLLRCNGATGLTERESMKLRNWMSAE